MKKKKEEPLETQQEKKGRSFVIHSRHGSVKERSEKNFSRRKHSSKKSNHQPSEFSKLESAADSLTKGEIAKLHEQILILQDKLKKVEERQEQIDKLESNLNKF